MSDASEDLHVDERRLAAILAADVAGYSRLMGRNEDETARDLEAHQAAILPIIARHGGSVINIAGDGIVAQFPSAVRAVECAVAMQKIMAERNFDVPADRRMLLRIGVNLGDIIHDGTHTYGDGINVAARLEPLAEPGGICISAPVREAIFGKLGLPLRDVGEKSLKNIARPVHVYEIRPPGTRARRDWLSGALRHYRRLAPSLGLVVLIAVLAGAAAWRFWPRPTSNSDGLPTVAVLPFSADRNDPKQSDFARNVTREVSAYLSTYTDAHTLTMPESAQEAAPRQAGASYLLDGDIGKADGRTRVRARLTDAASGESLWSEQYDFESSDGLAMQAETASKIYGALGGSFGKISKAEMEKAWRKPKSDLTVRDYALRALSQYVPETLEGLARVRQIAEEGLARFPNAAALNLHMAHTLILEQMDLGPFSDCHEKFALAWKYAKEADKYKSTLRVLEAFYHTVMAKLFALHANDFDRSIEEAEAALEIAPNDAVNRSALSTFLSSAGKIDESIEWGTKAIRQEHNAAFARFLKSNLAWNLYLARRYDEALEALKGSEMVSPDVTVSLFAHVGRLDEARSIVAEWQKQTPHSIATQACYAIKEPMKSMYLDDLRKAGLPEK
jgi:adenylate cyclase